MGIFYARIGCQATENQGFRTAWGGVLHYLSGLSINAMSYLCMNQFLILVCFKIAGNVHGMAFEILVRVTIFIITMASILLIDRLIGKTKFKMIVGK